MPVIIDFRKTACEKSPTFYLARIVQFLSKLFDKFIDGVLGWVQFILGEERIH